MRVSASVRVGLTLFVASTVVAASALAGRPSPVTVVDSLGAATATTVFDATGSGGISLLATQNVGPEFTITDKTTITEIGGFISGSAQVQIRPATNGLPDSSTVVATFSLPTCPVGICYVAVQPAKNLKLRLPPGDYFALFAPQPGTEAGILNSAQAPFTYRADLIPMGFLNPTTGAASVSDQFGAVRILGTSHEAG